MIMITQESKLKFAIGVALVGAGIAWATFSWDHHHIGRATRHALNDDTQQVVASIPSPVPAPVEIEIPMPVPLGAAPPPPEQWQQKAQHQAVESKSKARITAAKPDVETVQAPVPVLQAPVSSWFDYLDRIVSAVVSLSGAYVLVFNARKSNSTPVSQQSNNSGPTAA
jgi:hypothetical protein